MKEVKSNLEKYLNAWKDRDFGVMHEQCTKTYKVANTKFQLEAIVPQDVTGFKIGASKKSTEVVYDTDLTVTVDGKERKLTARSVCEEVPLAASVKGVWGVNPISVTRGLN